MDWGAPIQGPNKMSKHFSGYKDKLDVAVLVGCTDGSIVDKRSEEKLQILCYFLRGLDTMNETRRPVGASFYTTLHFLFRGRPRAEKKLIIQASNHSVSGPVPFIRYFVFSFSGRFVE